MLSKSYDNLDEEESSDSQFSDVSSSNDSGVTLRSLTSGGLHRTLHCYLIRDHEDKKSTQKKSFIISFFHKQS